MERVAGGVYTREVFEIEACRQLLPGVELLTPLGNLSNEPKGWADVNRVALAFALIVCAYVCVAAAATVPRPPEEDNQEYLLDIVTNEYSREWREAWDAGDNRFRFRLGSNNVSQWFIEEELKLAVRLNKRLRFRFYHARLDRFTTERIPWDVLEFEGQVSPSWYLA